MRKYKLKCFFLIFFFNFFFHIKNLCYCNGAYHYLYELAATAVATDGACSR